MRLVLDHPDGIERDDSGRELSLSFATSDHDIACTIVSIDPAAIHEMLEPFVGVPSRVILELWPIPETDERDLSRLSFEELLAERPRVCHRIATAAEAAACARDPMLDRPKGSISQADAELHRAQRSLEILDRELRRQMDG